MNGSTHGSLRIDQCGPQTLSGRYIRRFWMPFAMLDDVVPGRARDIAILGERFTYYRGLSGAPHLVASLCAHRHVQLSVGWVEDECIRCPYHGWKYDASGQCVEQPAEFESFADKVQIRSCPTRVFHGIVFGYFGPGEPPAFPRIATLERAGYIASTSYVRRTNFLNAVENNADWFHINFVHGRSSFTGVGVNRALPTISAEETEYGIAGRCTYADGKITRFHLLMPLSSYFEAPFNDDLVLGDQVAWRVPIDDRSHRSFIVRRIPIEGAALQKYLETSRDQARLQASLGPQSEVVDAILRGDLHVDEVSQLRPDIVGIQDEAVMLTQGPLGDREPDRLGVSDIPVIKLRRLWFREVEALANDEPLTNWDWSAEGLTAQLGV